jgi:hypothetical protein
MEYWNRVRLKPKVVHREKGDMPFVQPLPDDHNLGIVGKQFQKVLQEHDTEHEQPSENKLEMKKYHMSLKEK